MAFHLLLAALLGLVFGPDSPSEKQGVLRTGEIVLTLAPDENSTLYLTRNDVLKEPSNEQPNRSSAVEISPEPPPLDGFSTRDRSLTGKTEIENSIEVQSMVNSATRNSKFEFRLSESDLQLIESDRRRFEEAESTGPATSIRVFGSGDLNGRKFVFLIDRSKSMGEQGLRVLKHAARELSESIEQLQPNHMFQIVAYNDHVTTLQKKSLLPATPQNKAFVKPFINNLLAYGATNHISGIYTALAFQPDVILILNDGGFPELNAGQIEEISRLSSEIEIHALHFGLGPSQSSHHFMKQLAESCRGTYRYIDIRNWRKQSAVRQP